MLIKQTKEMTARERIAVQNSNNQFLQAISYVAIGTIYPYAGDNIPDTFMLCDGSSLDITEHSELFNVLGYTFGGNGETFNLPDLRGKVLVGADVGSALPLGKPLSKDVLTNEYDDAPHEVLPEYLCCNYIIKVSNEITKNDFRFPVDEEYNPNSDNAQSGIAVAEAIEGNEIYARNTFANALKGTKSGSAISVNDVSVVEHSLGVRVASKNLLAIDTIIPQKNVYISNGIISQIDSDTNNSPNVKLQSYNNNDYVNTIKTTPVQLGIISFVFTKDNTFNRLVFGLNGSATDTTVIIDLSTLQDGDYVIQGNFTNITQGSVSWQDMQVEVGTTATEYAPYVNVSTVNVSRYGKNLIKYPYNITNQTTKNGITFTDNGDGTVTLNGTATEIAYFEIVKPYTYLTKSNYFLSGCADSGDYGNYAIQIDCNGTAFYDFGNGVAIPKTADVSKCRFFIQVKSGVTVNNITFKPQLEIGTTATEYEPYKEPQTATANVDGTVEGLTSLSPNMTLVSDTEGVVINLEYNIDTKMYIDNELAKIKAELSAAIVNS